MAILSGLIAMSVSNKDAELALHNNLPQIALHLIKILAIKDSTPYRIGWENEIDNWLDDIYNKITNIKTRSRVLSMSSITKQVMDCRELEHKRQDRIKTQIKVKWCRDINHAPLYFKEISYMVLFKDIQELLIDIFDAMVKDEWSFTIRTDLHYQHLLQKYCM